MPTPDLSQAPILIVDDNPANLALLEDVLYEAGYDVVTSLSDPREVMPLIRSTTSIDLILLDIRMPHLSGIQVLEQLSAHYEQDPGAMPPVIVLTAQTDEQTRQQALSAGARDFLTKPFAHWEVELRIRNHLNARAHYNQNRLYSQHLESLVTERTHEVKETQLEIVRRLARAGEYRDNETGMHVIRMSKMCQQLAKLAQCDDDFCEMILFASPLHDLGKIGIPDAILLKPGRLTEDEFKIMRQHAQIGHDILKDHPAPLLQMAARIAITHHEKWDGSGYPHQLAGEDIPLEGRISAICDVFDALMSERPYKKAWPEAKAVQLLKDEAGRHFDPHLVALFLDHLESMQQIRAQYADTGEAFITLVS
ncbi:putative two-component system response regulator [Allopseudospirillum japonicum]|uniref:Putative two-component system response regulator n=1 Tax=Allopseudospirillum japonicum TaxID=64971 RepID=A0A1H6QRA8_9GAMM|nr:HD domain-containing phosphohydrolase [Allopseudospirillum japonicum]SEI41765.1 putative two-component system response regulator [Allopseudospirillum japonicum]